MGVFINTNVLSLVAQHSLGNAQNGLGQAITRLSTGLRINSARDDAAGLAISERLTAQIRGLTVASRNTNDAISALSTADGSLSAVGNLLQRARELAVQSASDSNNSTDRNSLNGELGTILAELDRLSNSAEFSGKKLLDGTYVNQQFQVGANEGQTISFSINSTQTDDLGAIVRSGVSVSSTALAGLGTGSTLTVNGTAIVVGSIGTDSLADVISRLNAGGARAEANSQTVVQTTAAFTAATGAGANSITINGVNITLTTGNAGTFALFATTLNAQSNQTGVSVTGIGAAGSGGVIFTRSSGGDIAITEVATGTNIIGDAVASTAARTFSAGISFNVDLSSSLSVGTGGVAVGLGHTATSVTNVTERVNGLNVATVSGANSAIGTIDLALDQVNRIRSSLGAAQNRFSSVIGSLQVGIQNLSAARSLVRDADIAAESAALVQQQILLQAGVAVLAQANQLPSIALSLLGG